MELVRYWKVVQKSWWLIGLLVVTVVGSTAFFTLNQPAQYESAATLLLNPALPSDLIPYYQGTAASNLADSYSELMRSTSFAQSVVKELPFSLTPEQVVEAVSTRLVPNTLFYKISAQAGSPEQARQLVETVVKVFLSANAVQQKQQQDERDSSRRSAASQQLDAKLKDLGAQIQSYKDVIARLEAQPPSADRDGQLLPLRGQLITLEQTETEALVASANLAEASSALNTAIVIDPAQPGLPAPRRLLTNLVIALVAGLVLGVGLAFLRDYLDYTVRSPEYMEEVLGLTPLAVIGVVGRDGSAVYGGRGKRRTRASAANRAGMGADGDPDLLNGRNLVTLEHPKSPESESFRVLRTNIQFCSMDRPVRSMVVTSAAPREGKSFTAANLAIVLAQAGKRVVLVDTDLRRPSLHKLFDLPNTIGFTNLVLNSDAVGEDVIQAPPAIPHLFVITSGPLPPNPSELLSAPQTAQVMAELSQYADAVIYDAPPAAAVTDPVILATRVDAVVLVISAGVTRREMVRRVQQQLANVGMHVLIPVLNRVKARDMHGYYYYYHGYGSPTAAPATNGHHPSANGNGKVPAEAVKTGIAED